jgi:hypothetical protein
VVGGKNVANVLGSTKEAIEASTVLTPCVTSESSGVARISPRSPICRSSPVVVVMARKAWYQSKPRTRGRFATSACDPLQRGLVAEGLGFEYERRKSLLSRPVPSLGHPSEAYKSSTCCSISAPRRLVHT